MVQKVSSRTGFENSVIQKTASSPKQNTGLSLNAKIGLTSLGVFSCLMGYLALGNNSSLPNLPAQLPSSSISASKIVNSISLSILVAIGLKKMNDSRSTAREEKIKSESKKQIKLELIEINDDLETQKKSLQEWWDLSGDYSKHLCSQMPDLSESKIKVLYQILKSIEFELKDLNGEIDESKFLTMYRYGNSKIAYRVDFEDIKNWEPKLSISEQHEFKKFFAGLILSLDKLFFAFQSDTNGARTQFLIFKNNNCTISHKDLSGYSGVIFTREGKIDKPENTQWETDESGICRQVNEKESNEKEENVEVTSNKQIPLEELREKKDKDIQKSDNHKKKSKSEDKIKINFIVPTVDLETQKNALQKWWRLSGDYHSEQCSQMPELSDQDVGVLYYIIRSLHDGKDNNPLIIKEKGLEYSHYAYVVNFSKFPHWEPKPPISQIEFQKFFGGYLLSVESKFFAFQGNPGNLGDLDDDDEFVVFKNLTFQIYIDYLKGSNPVLFTREGRIDKPVNTMWWIGKDGICRQFKEEQPDEKEKMLK